MTVATRLVTYVELDAAGRAGPRLSVSARLDAVLDDGRRVVLLDDRGWGSTERTRGAGVREIEETARMVVGPDEPPEDRSHEEEAALHWAYLAGRLRRRGVDVDGPALARLPHDVTLGPILRGRL